MKYLKLTIFVLAIGFLMSCEKDSAPNEAQFDAVDDSSCMYFKFVHAYPFATPSYTTPANGPTLHLSSNKGQLSATPFALGTTVPTGQDYLRIDGISWSYFNVRMATGVPPAAVKDSLLFSLNVPFQPGKYYSMFLVDSLNQPNRRLLLVEDDVRLPKENNFYKIRFANLVANLPSGTPTLELFSRRAGAVIFSNINYKGVTSFSEFQVQGTTSAISDTLQIRYTGSTTALATLNGVGITAKSVITVMAIGHVGSTGTRAPRIAVHRNR